MNRSTGKPSFWATWAGAGLGLLVLTAAPPQVLARTYKPDYLPPVPTGDPTADDEPSPTPKGGYASVRPDAQASVRQRGAMISRSAVTERLIWLSLVRTWIRIGVR